MKRAIAKGLGALGALCSLGSGLFWYLSASVQLDSGPNLKTVLSSAEKLTLLINQYNFWAACSAALAGVVIGLAIFLDD